MNWQNLKINRCPKCGSPLKAKGVLEAIYYCIDENECMFQINDKSYTQIITDRFKPRSFRKRDEIEDRIREANNEDRELVAEDFSKSPALNKL